MAKHPAMDTSGIDNQPTILDKLRQSKETYREAIAKGNELHHEFLPERADIASRNNNQMLETAIKQLDHIKASIQTYTSIK
jgi:hypothetical protein